MIQFMLIISFLLHIVLLMAVYHLFQQVQLSKKDNTNDITNLFESYLQEIKDENNRLQGELLVNTTQHNQEEKLDKQDSKTNQYTPITPNNIDDHYEASLQAQILQLYNEGMLVEEIANRLGCGTTEAGLIIKLYEKRSLKA